MTERIAYKEEKRIELSTDRQCRICGAWFWHSDPEWCEDTRHCAECEDSLREADNTFPAGADCTGLPDGQTANNGSNCDTVRPNLILATGGETISSIKRAVGNEIAEKMIAEQNQERAS